jgi:hypothetical protein
MLYFEDLDIGHSESSEPTQLSEAEIIEFAHRSDPQLECYPFRLLTVGT